METRTQKVEQKPLGVLDTLVSGFELIWLNPWIPLVPITLDVFLWLGPQVRARPIFQQIITILSRLTLAHASAETLQDIELLKGALQTIGDTLNMFSILAIGMPSVIGWQAPPVTLSRFELVIGEPILLLTMILGLLIGAVLVAAMYLELTACPIRNDAVAPSFFARWLRAGVDLLLLALLVLTGVSLLLIPMTVVVGTLSVASQALGSFLLLCGMMLIFWAMLYLVFAVPAIFVSRVNAPQALINSVSIFRFDFWSAIRLVLVVYLLRSGFAIVWEWFATNVWGVIFVVIVNAFLSSALIAAEMIFYKDRIAWVTKVKEKR